MVLMVSIAIIPRWSQSRNMGSNGRRVGRKNCWSGLQFFSLNCFEMLLQVVAGFARRVKRALSSSNFDLRCIHSE